MKAVIVKELPVSATGARGCLVEIGGEFYRVSSVGFETLVFPCDSEGEVTDWGEVAGGRGMSREEAIRDLEEAKP